MEVVLLGEVSRFGIDLRSRMRGERAVRLKIRKLNGTRLLVSLKLSQLRFQIVTRMRYLSEWTVRARNLRLRP